MERVDVHDEHLLRRFWEARREADMFCRPYAEPGSYDDMAQQLRSSNPSREMIAFVARDGDEVVGGSVLGCPLLDNTHLGSAYPLVRPRFRRRGVGLAILSAVVSALRERHRTLFIVEAHKPLEGETSPGWSFLRHHGFTIGILDLHRVLELPVPADLLDELAADAEPHHRGYQLITWQRHAPDEWVEGVCRLQEAFNAEAPSEELELEPEVWDAERLRGREERMQSMGRTETTTVAVTQEGAVVAVRQEGAVVALTEMLVLDHGRGAAFQGGTLVLPEHRGHRLGIAIKVANLRGFQESTPKAALVHSWNAEENGPMVRINDALGFRPVEHLAEMQLKL